LRKFTVSASMVERENKRERREGSIKGKGDRNGRWCTIGGPKSFTFLKLM